MKKTGLNIRIIIKMFVFFFLGVHLNAKGFKNTQGMSNPVPAGYFKSITVLDGLSNDWVQDMEQDHLGFIWLATSDGLNRFDGSIIKRYKVENSGLNNNFITKIYPEADSALWICNFNGLDLYDYKKDSFLHYVVDTSEHAGIVDLVGFNKDSLLLVVPKKGLVFFNKKTKAFHPVSFHGDSILSSTTKVYRILVDNNENIWLGYRSGSIACLDHDFNIKFYYPNLDFISTEVEHISKIVQVNDSSIWVGAFGAGIIEFDVNGKLRGSYNAENSFLTSNLITDLYSDQDNNTWVSLEEEGLLVVTEDRNRYMFRNKPGSVYSLNSNTITFVKQTRDGTYWIGHHGSGVNIFDPGIQHFYANNVSTPSLFRLSYNEIISCHVDNNNNLWIGTDGEGLYRHNLNTAATIKYTSKSVAIKNANLNKVKCITQDNKNNIWMGSYLGGLIKYTTDKNTFKAFMPKVDESTSRLFSIWDLAFDAKRNCIWVVSLNFGVYKFDILTEQFTHISEIGENSNTQDIECLYLQDSILWIGAISEGINKYNIANRTIETYTNTEDDLWVLNITPVNKESLLIGTHAKGLKIFNTKTGLLDDFRKDITQPDNIIYSVIRYDSLNVWCSTSKGLLHISMTDSAIKRYDSHSGINIRRFSKNAVAKDKEGQLYFAGNTGFIYFNPALVKTTNYNAPIYITSFKIDNKEVPVTKHGALHKNIVLTDTIFLHYKQNNISIEFAAVQYSLAKQIDYSYYLEGFEEEWSYTGTSNTATYTNLEPGVYKFHVRTVNEIYSNQPKTLTLVIPPPFWQTWWFISVILVLLIALMVLLLNIRLRYLRNRQKVLKRLVTSQTADLTKAYSLLQTRQKKILQQNQEIQDKNNELQEHRENLEQLVQIRTADLNKALEKAKESDRLKSAFLANISHEIRTPMNAILGFSSLLTADDDISNDEKELFAKQINTNGDILMKLLNDLIEISKIESKVIHIEKHKCNLKRILQQVYQNYKQNNANNNIGFKLVLSDALPEVILSDQLRLTQVINNLVDNAFKYTEQGEIQVAADITPDNIIKISVSDTGIGIKEDKLPSVFDRFVTVHDSKKKIYRGAGLGLSISKQLAVLMGGDLTVQSQINEGSVFYLTLPLAVPKVKDPYVDAKITDIITTNIATDWQGKTILIVEDEFTNFNYLKHALKKTKLNILKAESGKEALTIVNSHGHELQAVLLDIKLPDMSGITVFKLIRESFPALPVIAQTAFAFVDDRQEILQAGFNEFLAKPIKINDLFIVLNKYLEQHQD